MTQQWHHEQGEGSRKEHDASQARRKRMKEQAQARKTGVTGEEVERIHEPSLAVRPFTSVDFSEAVLFMPPEWTFTGMSEAEIQAETRMDLAASLASSTFALVATIDDGSFFDPACVGCLLARISGEEALPGHDGWLETCAAAMAELEGKGPAAAQGLLYDQQSDERRKLLLDAAAGAQGVDNEAVLFFVAPQARGHGVGSALMVALEEHLRACGQPSYWLQTDSCCSWQWYDRHGYERVADVGVPDSFAMPPMPADAPKGERPRLFLYRKDL